MKNGSKDSAATPTKSTSTRPGNPPRWLVVVLMLAIVGGIATQGLVKPKPKFETPESQLLGIERVIPLGPQLPNPGAFRFSEHSLAHDPATDHFWIVAQSFPRGQHRLAVTASLNGGQTLQPPVDVMPLLPPMKEVQMAITYGPGRALYLAVQGTVGKQGQQTGILRSTDDGATWSLWWHRPDNGYRLNKYGCQLIAWNNQLVLLYSAQKSGSPSGLFAELLQTDGTATPPQLIAADPPNDDRDLRQVLATPGALHLLAWSGGGPVPHSAAVCGLSATGEALPVQELPITRGHKLVDAALLNDADGDPVVLVKLDTPPSAFIQLFSRSHPNSQISNPRVPTNRYSWNAQSLQWNLQTGAEGPALFSGMKSPSDGLLQSILVDHTQPRQGYFIDELATDGHWSDRWELVLPQSSWSQIFGTIQLNDGRFVMLGSEQQTTNPAQNVLLITDPLPGIDATESAEKSPEKTP